MLLLEQQSFFIKKKKKSLSFLQPDQAPLSLLQRAPLGTGKMSSTAGPPLRKHRAARVQERVRVCRKGMREGENVCVLSLIRKFNWMEFGSFFFLPSELAAINRLFSFPFILQWFVDLHLLCWHCLR